MSRGKEIIFVLLFLLFSELLIAQSYNVRLMEDVVYKKDGKILRGTIIEQVMNQYIKIRVKTGEVITVEYKDIEKIEKKPTLTKTQPMVVLPPPSPYTPYEAPVVFKEKKSVAVAWALSFFLGWGAGHYYLGNKKTGLIFTLVDLVCAIIGITGCVLFFTAHGPEQALMGLNFWSVGVGVFFLSWLIDWITAILLAQEYNREVELQYYVPTY